MYLFPGDEHIYIHTKNTHTQRHTPHILHITSPHGHLRITESNPLTHSHTLMSSLLFFFGQFWAFPIPACVVYKGQVSPSSHPTQSTSLLIPCPENSMSSPLFSTPLSISSASNKFQDCNQGFECPIFTHPEVLGCYQLSPPPQRLPHGIRFAPVCISLGF